MSQSMQRRVLSLTGFHASDIPQFEQRKSGLANRLEWRRPGVAEGGSERVIVRSETFLTEPKTTDKTARTPILTLDEMDPAKPFAAVAAGLERVASLIHLSSS